MEQTQIVTLHEDGTGRLYLVQAGAAQALDVTDAAWVNAFEGDAVALLDGDTTHWTVPRVPADEVQGLPVVARYDGASGEVLLVNDLASGGLPSSNARAYIGGARYIEETD